MFCCSGSFNFSCTGIFDFIAENNLLWAFELETTTVLRYLQVLLAAHLLDRI